MSHALYDALGVPPDATPADVKKAYRKLVLLHHPDKGGDAEVFRRVSDAYAVLSDPERRSRYDLLGDALSQESSFDAPWPAPFGRQKHADHIHVLEVPLEDAYRGKSRRLNVNLQRACGGCCGPCIACSGTGVRTDVRRIAGFTHTTTATCSACGGAGHTAKGCRACGFKGFEVRKQEVTVDVPAGVVSGWRTRFSGLGQQSAPGSAHASGDLYVEIRVARHPQFDVRGRHLLHVARMPLSDSLVGTGVRVPHFDGDILVAQNKMVRHGDEIRVPGKGYAKSEGDLFVLFDVEYPESREPPNGERRDMLLRALRPP